MDAETPPPDRPPRPTPDPSGAFAVGYKPHQGDLMVYGGGALTLIGVVATFVNVQPGFLLASLAGSLSALYFHPTLDLETPQLAADAKGLYVARYGIIPWSAIGAIRVEHRALRTMRLATLIVETKEPLEAVISAPDRLSLIQRFTARNARRKGGRLHVELHTLAVAPETIERRLRSLYGAGTS
ncbi:MAG: hypothetical protein AAF318_12865 [Pseudomonadota bacterium]